MRFIVAAATALSLTATSLLAAETRALPPGKPAGVTKAQSNREMAWGGLGAGAVFGVVLFMAENETATTTTTTITTTK